MIEHSRHARSCFARALDGIGATGAMSFGSTGSDIVGGDGGQCLRGERAVDSVVVPSITCS